MARSISRLSRTSSQTRTTSTSTGLPDGYPSHRATSATAQAAGRVYEPKVSHEAHAAKDRRIRGGCLAGSPLSSFRGACARLLFVVGVAGNVLEHSRAFLVHGLKWRQRLRWHCREY